MPDEDEMDNTMNGDIDDSEGEDEEQSQAPVDQALLTQARPARLPVVPPVSPMVAPDALPIESATRKRGWNWVGSSSRSEAQKGDGISDLFRTDFDKDLEDVNDLVTVDVERDIVDAGHDGTLDDLVDVFPEDIMGVNSLGQKPSRMQLRRLRAERKARRRAGEQSTSMGGIGR